VTVRQRPRLASYEAAGNLLFLLTSSSSCMLLPLDHRQGLSSSSYNWHLSLETLRARPVGLQTLWPSLSTVRPLPPLGPLYFQESFGMPTTSPAIFQTWIWRRGRGSIWHGGVADLQKATSSFLPTLTSVPCLKRVNTLVSASYIALYIHQPVPPPLTVFPVSKSNSCK
jgi:hypothetical protein